MKKIRVFEAVESLGDKKNGYWWKKGDLMYENPFGIWMVRASCLIVKASNVTDIARISGYCRCEIFKCINMNLVTIRSNRKVKVIRHRGKIYVIKKKNYARQKHDKVFDMAT